jgi:ribonuclease-3
LVRKRIPVRDQDLLSKALRHRSAAGQEATESNERLEFFGDAVLGMVIAEHLLRTHPDWDQGLLTKAKAMVVQEATLAEAGLLLGLDTLVEIGPGEEITGGRKRASIVCDAYEAVVGAVYLDRGLATARRFILKRPF